MDGRTPGGREAPGDRTRRTGRLVRRLSAEPNSAPSVTGALRNFAKDRRRRWEISTDSKSNRDLVGPARGEYMHELTRRPLDNTKDGLDLADGPYTQAPEYLGGFWVVEAPDRDVASPGPPRRPRPLGPRIEVCAFQEVPAWRGAPRPVFSRLRQRHHGRPRSTRSGRP